MAINSWLNIPYASINGIDIQYDSTLDDLVLAFASSVANTTASYTRNIDMTTKSVNSLGSVFKTSGGSYTPYWSPNGEYLAVRVTASGGGIAFGYKDSSIPSITTLSGTYSVLSNIGGGWLGSNVFLALENNSRNTYRYTCSPSGVTQTIMNNYLPSPTEGQDIRGNVFGDIAVPVQASTYPFVILKSNGTSVSGISYATDAADQTTKTIRGLSWSHDGTVLLVVYSDDTSQAFDWSSRSTIDLISGYTNNLDFTGMHNAQHRAALHYSVDGRYLIIGRWQSPSLRIYEISGEGPNATFSLASGPDILPPTYVMGIASTTVPSKPGLVYFTTGSTNTPHINIYEATAAMPKLTGVAVTGTGYTTTDLDWDDYPSPDLVRYEVMVDGGTPIDVGTTSSYTVTNLAPGTEYDFQVRAVLTSDSTSWTNAVSASTITLDAPTGPSLVSKDLSSITIEWQAVTGADGYEVQQYQDTPVDVGTDLTYTDTGLNPGGAYTYRVRATLGSYTSAWTNYLNVSAVTLGTPGALQTVGVLHDELTVTWEDVADATGFELEIDGNPISLGKVTSYHHTGLLPGTTYNYRIRSVYDVAPSYGVSEYSAVVSETTADPPIPANFRTTGKTGATVSLAWDDVTSETGYTITRDGQELTTVGSNVLEYQDTGLTPGTTYTYQVQADYSETIQSPLSASIDVTTTSPPSAPTNVVASHVDHDNVILSWDSVSGATGYIIERDSTLLTEVTGVTSYDDTTVDAETVYSYAVAAVIEFDGGERLVSESSQLLSVETDPTPAVGAPDGVGLGRWPLTDVTLGRPSDDPSDQVRRFTVAEPPN